MPDQTLQRALTQQVDPAAAITLDGAHQNTDGRRDGSQGETEQDRYAKAIDEPGDHIAALVVGTQPVFRRRRAWRRRRQVVVDRVVAVGHQRPQHPALVVDQIGNKGIAIVGRGFEIAAEGGFRVAVENGQIDATIVPNQKRLVVGNELGRQGEQKQRHEDPERPMATPVGAKLLQASPVESIYFDERHCQLTSRLSKSIRGSTTTYIMSPTRFMSRPRSVNI